jgi:CheY-like chemotaxis protein/HPt (histidine-containing phosphotransfer) domain-containing protein
MSTLDDFAATLAVRAHEKGLEFLCAADPDVPFLLQGDPGRLRQILTNLVGNAIKFTRQGEVAVRVTRTDSQSKTANPKSEIGNQVELRFSIRDTGIGIPPDKLGLLFNKFSQVDASTTRQYGGTGLGLAISKQLVTLMGGQVGVRSEVGQGSEFWFTVRLGLQPVDAPDEHSETPALAKLDGVRILVVDDNTTSREILRMRLTSWGMRSTEVDGGRVALKALAAALQQGDPFQVVILDMQMPEMDGATLGEMIKSDKSLSETLLVLLSSLGERGDARRFAQIGFSGYLVKPMRHTDLFNVLSTALAGNALPVDAPRPIVTRHSAREIIRAEANPGYDGMNEITGKRILLAEDNITNQQVAMGILKKFGLRVDVVANGAEALTALKSIPYDLVLMDVQMPVMDGLEASMCIRDAQSAVLNHNIPIVAMTANAMLGDRNRCLTAGMNDYIAKPVKPQALAQILRRWLAGAVETQSANPQDAAQTIEASHLPVPVALQTKPIFDKAVMLRRMMNDDELVRLIISGFLDDIPLQIQALKDYLKVGDATGAERQAHTIKGASANVSAELLREVAFEMEKSGKFGDLDAMRKSMGELELQFAHLKEELEKVI